MPSIKTNRNRYLLGIYAAIVQENNDPKKLCRLRIKIPSILGEVIHPSWAEPCLPSTEVVTIPPKGAQVWVAFEEGSPDNPIWLGSFMKDTEPHNEAKSGSPKVRSIKTEESLRISLDDNVKEIQIDTGGDAIITMKKVDGKIIIDAENVFIGTNAGQALVRGDAFRELFNSHTHISSAPGIPTSAPIETCDAPSANTHLSSKHRVE